MQITPNIISNTCIGSYITTHCLGKPIQNPFAWAVIDTDSICALLANFYTINWANISINQIDDFFRITIDNAVRVNYIHYHIDRSSAQLTKNGPDLYYNKMEHYVLTKYFERLKRMVLSRTPPTFVLGFANGKALSKYYWTQNDVIKACSTPTKFTRIVSFEYDVSPNILNNIEYIHQPNHFLDNGLEFSEYVYKHSSLSRQGK